MKKMRTLILGETEIGRKIEKEWLNLKRKYRKKYTERERKKLEDVQIGKYRNKIKYKKMEENYINIQKNSETNLNRQKQREI